MKVLSLHWPCSSITPVGRERAPPYSWGRAGRVKIQASHMVSTDPSGTDVVTTLWDEPCFSDTFPAQRLGHLMTAWQGWNEGSTLGLCWCESGRASFFYDVWLEESNHRLKHSVLPDFDFLFSGPSARETKLFLGLYCLYLIVSGLPAASGPNLIYLRQKEIPRNLVLCCSLYVKVFGQSAFFLHLFRVVLHLFYI